MPTITHKRLKKYQNAERQLKTFLSGQIWHDYSELKERNRRRGLVIMVLACTLMSAVGAFIFLHF